MKLFKQFLFLGLTITLFLSSCTMEKRVYMSGYHIEWNKSKHAVNKQEFANKENEKQPHQNKITTPQLSEKNHHSIGIIAEKQITKSLKQKNIFRINKSSIYINPSKVDTTLAKGNDKKENGFNTLKEKKKISGFAIAGIACLLVGIFILSVPVLFEISMSLYVLFLSSIFVLGISIIFSALGISETKKDKKQGNIIATICLGLGIISLMLVTGILVFYTLIELLISFF